jgi:cobalt-zinc-cadmium efflux system outer membrane protein
MFRLIAVLTLSSVTNLVQAEPLSFDAALELAQRSAPDLTVQTASVAAAQAAVIAAGRLPDPKLAIGVDNVPASGADQWSLTRDFMTMRKIGLMQDIPNRGKRQAEVDVATAAIAQAQAERRVRLLQIKRDTAVAWLTRFYLERRATFFDDLDRENRLFADAVQAQLAGGRGLPADVIAPQQEAAELADRRDELSGEIAKANAMLRRWVGAAADESLTHDAPTFSIDGEHLRTHVHEHPELAVFTPMMEIAQAEVHGAEAMKRPDWGVELLYGHRGAAFSDMVSLQFTLGLPVFSGTRQDPQIEAKRHAVTRLAAEREAMLRDHTQELETDLAEYGALTRQLDRMRATRVPLARQKVDYQFASYRAGKGDLTAVLTARRELIDAQLQQLTLEAQQATTIAKLYFIYGEGAQ